MGDAGVQVGWTDAQWGRVVDVVTEEVRKASVVAAILPSYGPTPEGLDVVRKDKVSWDKAANVVTVQDVETMPLWTLEVYVRLRREQVRDESLSSALLAFRRAASLLTIAQDAIVFHGDPTSTTQKPRKSRYASTKPLNLDPGPKSDLVKQVAKPEGGITPEGIVGSGPVDVRLLPRPTTTRRTATSQPAPATTQVTRSAKDRRSDELYGGILVSAVKEAIRKLNDDNHSGPFACVLGNEAFFAAHEASGQSPVLPAKRMKGILNGPVLGSGSLAGHVGVVIATSAEPFDLVVGTPPEVEFLQVDIDISENYVFRVYERFVLRIKDDTAIYTFQVEQP